MIYFENYLFEEGLMIVGDHQDKTLFYFFPVAPRLALHPDGLPAFLFLKYADDPQSLPPGVEGGGGFLAFDCDLRVDADRLSDAAKAVKKKRDLDQTPRLVPIDYRRGGVRLMILDLDTSPPPQPAPADGSLPVKSSIVAPPGQRFVERASFSATPSLFGDNRATFNVELSKRGATLVEETLDMASSLVGIVYDLTFVGLKPGFNVTLKVDWKRVQHDIDERFQASFLFASVDIESFVSELIDNRVIEFEVVRFAAGSDDAALNDRTDEAAQFVKEMITDTFFEPSLNPSGAISDRWWEQVGSFAKSMRPTFAGYTKRDMTRIDTKSLDVSFREITAVERRILPQGHLQGLAGVLAGHPRDLFIRSVRLDDDFFKTVAVEVTVGGSFEALGFTGATIAFDYAGDAKALTFDKPNAPQSVKWFFDPPSGRSYRYRVEFFPGPDMPDGLESGFTSDWLVSNETRITLDPIRFFQPATVGFRLLDDEVLTRFPTIEIEASHENPAGGPARRKTLMLRPDQKTPSWRFLPFTPGEAEVTTRLRFLRANGTGLEIGPLVSRSDTVLIADPQPLRLEVEIIPSVDWTSLRQIIVDLRYEDAENGLRHAGKATFTEKTDVSSAWVIPIADADKRHYSYRVTFLAKTGAVRQWPFVSTDDERVFVTEDFLRETIVAVSSRGKSFDEAGIARIEVQFQYDPGAGQPVVTQDNTLSSRDATGEFRFTQTDPARPRYRYGVTFVGTDGSRRFEPDRESDSTKLVFSIV
ncbi:hypothetical protein CCR92_07095 [Rhodospirillum rubrum]|nr:hypothetical protein [Rhodospirillum rubrum]